MIVLKIPPKPDWLSFRPATPEDEPYVMGLYSTTIRNQTQLDALGLPPEQLDALIRYQYTAMMTHYNGNYPDADISIVLRDGEPVGRLIIIEFENEVRLGDLMIEPGYQNNGICTWIMRKYVNKGLAAGKKICLHVEKTNRAVNLYQRENFVIVQDLNSHWLMEYRPDEAELQRNGG